MKRKVNQTIGIATLGIVIILGTYFFSVEFVPEYISLLNREDRSTQRILTSGTDETSVSTIEIGENSGLQSAQDSIISEAPSSTTIADIQKTEEYTFVEIMKHNTTESCWTTIDGYVYDLTPYISSHPGGRRHIIEICGTNSSMEFNDKHGGEEKPSSSLLDFRIGTLTE